MKILLAGKYIPTGPRPIGGLQSWIRTIRAELERLGHEVTEWQPDMRLEGRYDLGVIANLPLTERALKACRGVVNVCHGIIEAERPSADYKRLFVSEGTRDHWGMTGDILRQPIDLDFWTPDENVERAHVTRFSYRTAPILGQEVADELGLPYRHVMDATPEEAREALQTSRLVFASGRAALESMACGAPTVIYDHRSAYQPPLVGIKFIEQIKQNYSGRGGIEHPKMRQVLFVSRMVIDELPPQRRWVEEHHDAKAITQQLLQYV